MNKQIEEIQDYSKSQKNSDRGFFIWLAFLAIFVTFFNITFVSGSSMDPTLKDKDILIMEKASVLFNNLNRGDIVSFKHTTYVDDDKNKSGIEDVFFIKRIIGIPGDVVEIKNGQVFVNGETVKEEYLPLNTLTFVIEEPSIKTTLKEDEYFVLGDNRGNSLDSRFKTVGSVHKDKIVAKKLIKVMNLS